MKTICVSSLKGGTGKSTTSHALGVALASEGIRVLLVDMDPQSTLTIICGVKDRDGLSMGEVLGAAHPGKLGMKDILCDLGGGLWLAPANLSMTTSELALVERLGRELLLRRALEKVADRFDLCIIDTHPGLALLTIASLVASDVVIIPTQPSIVDLHSLALFKDYALAQIQENLNPDISILGVLLTFFDGRTRHHQQALEFIKASQMPLFETKIGRSVKIQEAGGHGETILTFEPTNPQAENYRQLAREVIQWHQSQRERI